MWKLFKQILAKKACTHDWEEVKLTSVYNNDESKRPHRINILYLCRKCGEFKQIDLK